MACYDCRVCNISYPASRGGGNCPICEELTVWNHAGDEDETWEAQVLAAKGIYRAKDLPGLKPNYLTTAQGQTWVAGAVLESHGYPNAQELDIIRVEGATSDIFLELVGRTVKDVPGTLVRGWLVERVNWEGAGDKLTPEMFVGGG